MDLNREWVEKWVRCWINTQRRRTWGFLTSEQFHHPIPRPPGPPPPLINCTTGTMPRCETQSLWFAPLFYLILFLWRNERHFREILTHSRWCSTVGRVRYLAGEKATVFCPSLSLTGLTAANGQSKLCGKSTHRKMENSSSLEDVQQNSSIPIFSTLLKKKTVPWKEKKILKKVCEMSKYLTLIPLLREMCFPCYHSSLEKKMTDSGKLKFLCIFFW